MSKTKKEFKEESLEKTLWAAADKLRKNIDATECKHIVLGLIFLKYISDAFRDLYQKLVSLKKEAAEPKEQCVLFILKILRMQKLNKFFEIVTKF